jgi:hypothetical protein
VPRHEVGAPLVGAAEVAQILERVDPGRQHVLRAVVVEAVEELAHLDGRLLLAALPDPARRYAPALCVHGDSVRLLKSGSEGRLEARDSKPPLRIYLGDGGMNAHISPRRQAQCKDVPPRWTKHGLSVLDQLS